MIRLIKALAGFKHMTYRFIVNGLTHCTWLLGNNYVKQINIFDYFNRKYATVWRCLIPP